MATNKRRDSIIQLTIEELKKASKVTDQQLDTKIEQPDLPMLADFFESIDDGYLQMMKLNPGKQTDVKGKAHLNGTAAGMMLALQLWLNSQLKGSFRDLIVISLSLGKKSDAVQIFKYLSGEDFTPPSELSQECNPIGKMTLSSDCVLKEGGKRPTMEELRNFKTGEGKIDLVVKIGTDYRKLGYKLLLDNEKKVENIKASEQHQVENIVDEILKEWLKGSGKSPVTWNTLVEALREAGLVLLADDVSKMLK